MNIENDALKLRKQYQCVMKGWVDLRNLAVTKETYGKVLLQKLQKLEEELDLLYPEHSDDVNRFFCIFFCICYTCTQVCTVIPKELPGRF